jgi:rhodanese-related sulfurtransferase
MFGINEIDSQTLKAWQEDGKAIRLIDVRSQAEISQGIIKDGEPLPLNLLPLKTSELNDEHDIIFYCRSGARSAQACYYLMQQHGFERVYNLRGGIMDWVRTGNAIEAPA